MGEGIKFSVATNFRPDFIDAIAGYPVFEVFGKLPSDKIGGGRASFMLAPLSVKNFKRHVSDAGARGIGFNYLLNPACMDNREYTRQGQKDLMRILDFIEECGIGAVTISLPFLLPVIKRRHPKLKVRVGVYARVDSVAKARFWEDMGADCITLESISVNREFGLLERIRKAASLELQLIVNSNCLMFCPLSGQHMVNLSHASQKGHNSRGFMIDWCVLKCSHEKLLDPANYLRSEFIRPEDLKIYTDIGYSSFKILERAAPTPVMAARVKAYSEGKFEGNLLDLIQPYGYKEKPGGPGSGGTLNFWRYFLRPGAVRLGRLMKLRKLAAKRGMLAPLEGEPVVIDNKALDGFLAGFAGRDCRESDCAACGHCASYARRAVRVDVGYREEMLKLYDEVFEDMYSGRLWGV
jgi:collagenase-like PrtC family protease